MTMNGDLLEDLKRCDGYYICPKDSNGKRLGPLVGYAGKYEAPDGTKKAYVGDVYYNFAKMEQYPDLYVSYAAKLAINRIKTASFPFRIDVVLGAPMGGIILASDLGDLLECRRIFAEKKNTAAVIDGKLREESVIVLDRHEIIEGDRVLLVEDICNNFSTTDQLSQLVQKRGGKVVGVVCMINRSSKKKFIYKGQRIPVISFLDIPTLQYKQEDEEVVADIEAGNVVWKPKNEWARLEKAMAEAE